MKKALSKELWEKTFKEYVITDIAVRTNEIVHILARADWSQEKAAQVHDHEIPSRLLTVFTRDGELKLAAVQLQPFERPVLGVSLIPVAQAVVLSNSIDGPVLPVGGGRNDWDLELLEKGNFPLCRKIKCIEGYAWAVGGNRQIYRRADIGKWEIICKIEITDGNILDFGFDDLDGFSEQDVYAAGGIGDVWHYNGSEWTQCQFPFKEQLNIVCCAKDGFVYIAGRKGIWKGKENDWQKVCDVDTSNPIKTACWFKDKLWMTTDYDVYIWDGEKLETEVIYNNERLPLRGKLDCTDDIFFVANTYAVWSFDGKVWTEVVRPYDIYEEMEKEKK